MRVFNRVLVLLLILTPVVAAVALWLSRRRRRTLLQLSVGGLLGLVVIRRVVDWLTTTLTDTGQPANKSARRAILTHLFHQYFSISRWLLLGLVVVVVVALVTGPYGWARSLRRVVSRYAREGWNLVVAISGRARDDRTIEWVRSHLDLLRIVGVAVAVLLLIVLSVSWIGILVIAVLLAAYESGSTASGEPGLTPGTVCRWVRSWTPLPTMTCPHRADTGSPRRCNRDRCAESGRQQPARMPTGIAARFRSGSGFPGLLFDVDQLQAEVPDPIEQGVQPALGYVRGQDGDGRLALDRHIRKRLAPGRAQRSADPDLVGPVAHGDPLAARAVRGQDDKTGPRGITRCR